MRSTNTHTSTKQLQELITGLSSLDPHSPKGPLQTDQPIPPSSGPCRDRSRSRRRMLLVAVAVPLGLATLGGGAYLLTRSQDGDQADTLPSRTPAPGEKAGQWTAAPESKAGVESPQVVAGHRTGASMRGSTDKVTGSVTSSQNGDQVVVERARIVCELTAGGGDAVFELAAPFTVPSAGGKANAKGIMHVKQNVKPLELPVEVSFPSPGRMVWHTVSTVKFSDYGAEPPSLGGAVGLSDEATITIDPVFTK